MKPSQLVIALCLSAAGGLAQAQMIRTDKNMSLELANMMASAAMASCQAANLNVSVTVVDRAGIVRAVQRADNAGPHTIGASQAKAFTAASGKASTTTYLENSQKFPASQNLGQLPGFLLLGGGLPVRVGNEVIGGIGVGGAPSGAQDEQCAAAGIDKVKDHLK
jgi:uncharacterized protein GlcG (DUF336 family)